jgi:hypothetical protein
MKAAFILLLISLGNLATAAGEPMSFDLRASTTTVLLGAPVMIEGTVRFPDTFELSFKKERQKFDPFALTDIQMEPPASGGGMKTQTIHMTVVPFDLGTQTLPALQWTLTNASGATQTLQSPPMKFDVTGPDTHSAELRDIKGPLKPPAWILVLLALLAAATLGLAGYEFWILLRRKNGAPAGSAIRKPAHEEALEALESLRTAGLGLRETYDRLSEILRVYFERRFDIPALVLTTSDLIRMMRQAEIDRPVVGLARDLFARCDLVKFAKLIPEGPEFRQDLEAAIQIVKSTAPKPPPTPEESLSSAQGGRRSGLP